MALKQRKNKTIKLRLSEAEYELFNTVAKNNNKSLSAFIMEASLAKIRTLDDTLVPKDTTMNKNNLVAFNRIGNNLNQIAYSLNRLWFKKSIAPGMYKKALEDIFTISTLLSHLVITKK